MSCEVGFNIYKLESVETDTKEMKPKLILEEVKELESGLYICGNNDTSNLIINLLMRESEDLYSDYFIQGLLNEQSFYSGSIGLVRDSKETFKLKLLGRSLDEIERKILELQKECLDNETNVNDRLKKDIEELEKEIITLRTYQQKAETKVAFDGFQTQIDKCRETKVKLESYLDDDCYDTDYNKKLLDKIQIVRRLMEEYPDYLFTIYVSY